MPSDEPVDDFNVSNLGLQIRYRYELAPLSYLYVVYGRGGFEQDPAVGRFPDGCCATASACATTISCWSSSATASSPDSPYGPFR